MLALGATIALLLAADVPPDPCADIEATKIALLEAAKRGRGELDVAIARVQTLAGARLVSNAEEIATGRQRAELVAARLASLCAFVRRPPAAPREPAASAPSISDILSRPEFANARDRRRNAVDSLLSAILEWLKSLLATSAAQTFGAFSRWVRTLILTGAALLVMVAVLRIHALRRGPKVRRVEGAVGGPLALEDPATHLENARAAIESDPRAAIREGLLALLSVLERKRWARPDRVKTNRELAAELPKRGAPEEVFRRVDELVRWYDRTFYSLEPVRTEDAQKFIEAVASFQSQLTAGGSP